MGNLMLAPSVSKKKAPNFDHGLIRNKKVWLDLVLIGVCLRPMLKRLQQEISRQLHSVRAETVCN